MSAVKNFWFYAILLISIVVVILGIAIWTSGTSPAPQKTPEVSPSTSGLAQKATKKADSPPSSQTVPNDFPAPAKKLHQVINDAKTGDAELDQKLEKLNQQLAALKEQLEAQGVTVPENTTTPTDGSVAAAGLDDTQARLDAIKQHMQNKYV